MNLLINIVICFINLYIYRGRGCPITDMSQSWKRRVESNVHFQGQLPPQRTIGKDIPIMDPNSVGILGAGPSDQRSVSEKHFRTLPSRQGFSS